MVLNISVVLLLPHGGGQRVASAASKEAGGAWGWEATITVLSQMKFVLKLHACSMNVPQIPSMHMINTFLAYLLVQTEQKHIGMCVYVYISSIFKLVVRSTITIRRLKPSKQHCTDTSAHLLNL